MKYALLKSFAPPAAAVTFLLLSACSTSASAPQNAGQRISARGEAISARGAAWTNGQNNVQKGENLVAKSASKAVDGEEKLHRAQEAMARAEQQIQKALVDKSNGEQLIAGGTEQMQQAEAAYAEIRNRPSAVTPQ